MSDAPARYSAPGPAGDKASYSDWIKWWVTVADQREQIPSKSGKFPWEDRLPWPKRYWKRRVTKQQMLDEMILRHAKPEAVIKVELSHPDSFDQQFNPDFVRYRLIVRQVERVYAAYYYRIWVPLKTKVLGIWTKTQVL